MTIVLLLSGSSSAVAGPTLVTDRYPLAGKRSQLALNGSSVLIGGYESETTNVVRAFTPGRPLTTIARATIKPESGEFNDAMYFVASQSRLLMLDHGSSETYKGTGEIRYERLLTGPLGGPLSELPNTCQVTPTLDPAVISEAGIPAHSSIAVDGEVAAYDSYGCIAVRDFGTGLKRLLMLEATLDPVVKGTLQRLTEATTLRVAGRLLAYRRNPSDGEGPASVAIYDIDTGQELYRVSLPPEEATFDLQSDGTLVVADPTSCTATVSTIAQPSPHPLGVPACKVQRVLDGRALLVVPGQGKDRQLEWTSLREPSLHLVEDLGDEGVLEQAPADMDATNVVYTQASCWAAKVYRTSLLEPGAPPPAPRTCPISAPSGVATLTSKTLRVRLHCPLGCEGNLNAHVGTRRQVRKEEGGQSIIGIGLPNVPIPPGGYTTLTLLPGEAGEEATTARLLVRRLRHKQRLYVRLDFKIKTPDAGETFSHISVPVHLQRPVHKRSARHLHAGQR